MWDFEVLSFMSAYSVSSDRVLRNARQCAAILKRCSVIMFYPGQFQYKREREREGWERWSGAERRRGRRDYDPRIAPALPHALSLFLQLLASIYFSAGIYNQLLVGTKSGVVMEETSVGERSKSGCNLWTARHTTTNLDTFPTDKGKERCGKKIKWKPATDTYNVKYKELCW